MDGKGEHVIPVGSWVRIADRARLEQALRSAGDPAARPAPEQFGHAGRSACVRARLREDHGDLYRLRDVPGLWRQDWLEPIA